MTPDTKNIFLGHIKTFRQKKLYKYIINGLLINLRGYIIYSIITFFWLDPKIAVSIMYPIGATIGYFTHARHSFDYSGSFSNGVSKYIGAHFLGYLLNISIIYIFSDILGIHHQYSQLLAIALVALLLYFLFKNFVFRTDNI